MRVTDDEAAVEAVLALDGWNPAPLGPCGVRASQRRTVAEALVECVISNLSTDEMVERAARALCDPPDRNIDWKPHYDEIPEHIKDEVFRKNARNALSAAFSEARND